MNWIQLVGTTLIHFIWQGALLMGIAMGSLMLLKKSSSQAKYLALCGVLVAMTIAPIITAIVVAPDAVIREVPVHSIKPATISAPLPDIATTLESSLFDERYLKPIVSIWFIGVLALALRVFGGFLSLVGLRNKGHLPVPEELQIQFANLARRIGLRNIPTLRISSRVTVPTVIGAFRGIVLLPASVVTGMSPRMLETILAHELAHVARYDFLINALQSVIEVVLFYHPAVWWVSQRIREERENCCDDLVIATFSDRTTYARALTTLAELRGHSLAVRADGGELLGRIRRILGETPMKSIVSPIPVAILLGALVFVPAMQAFAASQNDPIAKKKPPVSQKKKPEKVKEVPVKMKEVPANPISLPTKTTEIREVPKLPEQSIKKAVGPNATTPAIREVRASETPKVAPPLWEVPRSHADGPPSPNAVVGPAPISNNPISEVTVPAQSLPGQMPSGSPFTGTKNSKDYLLYQLGQDIESQLEMRRTLLSMIRQGELYVLEKEFQMQALRKNPPEEDKAKRQWEKEFAQLRNDLMSAQESSERLEERLKVNEMKLAELRKKLDEANK